MSRQHTPGPWKVRLNQDCTFSLFGENGKKILISNAGLINREANARLIAAAPDLLEALIDCRLALDLAHANGELAVVDAAIAKATGSAP